MREVSQKLARAVIDLYEMNRPDDEVAADINTRWDALIARARDPGKSLRAHCRQQRLRREQLERRNAPQT